MEKILRGTNIIKSYGKGDEVSYALSGVNVEVSQGEFVAVMGPSGCGKSTLLFSLSGTDNIDSGQVEFDGLLFSSYTEDELANIRKTKMGFVFQQATMLKNLNLLDNILLPSLPSKKKRASETIQKAQELMKITGIFGLENRDTTEVSGGQLQRASICRALINDPKIIFADEPTGALNSKAAEEILELLLKIQKEGTAIFMVTHDAKVAARADRILFMKDGTVESELAFSNDTADSMDTIDSMEKKLEKIIEEMKKIGV